MVGVIGVVGVMVCVCVLGGGGGEGVPYTCTTGMRHEQDVQASERERGEVGEEDKGEGTVQAVSRPTCTCRR